MALPYLRSKEYTPQNRLDFFMREIYARQKQDNQPEEQKDWLHICQKYLAPYHLYLEKQYGFATGNMYSIEISDHPLQPRDVFTREYVQDFGSIMNYLEDCYGFQHRPKSYFYIRWKYRKLFSKVRYCTPAELGDKLVQLSRELVHHYTGKTIEPKWNINSYSLDFEWNQIDVNLIDDTEKTGTFVAIKAS